MTLAEEFATRNFSKSYCKAQPRDALLMECSRYLRSMVSRLCPLFMWNRTSFHPLVATPGIRRKYYAILAMLRHHTSRPKAYTCLSTFLEELTLIIWEPQDWSHLYISLLRGRNIEPFPCLYNDPVRSSLRVSSLD